MGPRAQVNQLQFTASAGLDAEDLLIFLFVVNERKFSFP